MHFPYEESSYSAKVPAKVPASSLAAHWVASQARTSATRHAVTPADSFTGAGNSSLATLRQSVAGEKGKIPRRAGLLGLPFRPGLSGAPTRSTARTKPASGRPSALAFSIISPFRPVLAVFRLRPPALALRAAAQVSRLFEDRITCAWWDRAWAPRAALAHTAARCSMAQTLFGACSQPRTSSTVNFPALDWSLV